METKECKLCGSVLPKTHDYFNWADRKRGSLRTMCKVCQRKERTEWYKIRKESYPEWHNAVLESHRQYYKDHKENCESQSREWKRAHRKEMQEAFNEYRRGKMKSDPVYAWTYKARRAVRNVVTNKGERDNRSSEFIKELTGLHTLELRNYLRETFRLLYGYEWDGVEPTHVDHIVPLCTQSTIDGRAKLFYYTNLRLLKEKDNRAKGTSLDYQISAEDIAKAYEEVTLPD